MTTTLENRSSLQQKKFKILYLNQAIEVKLTDLYSFELNEIIERVSILLYKCVQLYTLLDT